MQSERQWYECSAEMEGCRSEECYLKLLSKVDVPLVNLRKVPTSSPCPAAMNITEHAFLLTSAWRIERNLLDVDSVKAELQICVSFTFEYTDLYRKFLAKHKTLWSRQKSDYVLQIWDYFSIFVLASLKFTKCFPFLCYGNGQPTNTRWSWKGLIPKYQFNWPEWSLHPTPDHLGSSTVWSLTTTKVGTQTLWRALFILLENIRVNNSSGAHLNDEHGL